MYNKNYLSKDKRRLGVFFYNLTRNYHEDFIVFHGNQRHMEPRYTDRYSWHIMSTTRLNPCYIAFDHIFDDSCRNHDCWCCWQPDCLKAAMYASTFQYILHGIYFNTCRHYMPDCLFIIGMHDIFVMKNRFFKYFETLSSTKMAHTASLIWARTTISYSLSLYWGNLTSFKTFLMKYYRQHTKYFKVLLTDKPL